MTKERAREQYYCVQRAVSVQSYRKSVNEVTTHASSVTSLPCNKTPASHAIQYTNLVKHVGQRALVTVPHAHALNTRVKRVGQTFTVTQLLCGLCRHALRKYPTDDRALGASEAFPRAPRGPPSMFGMHNSGILRSLARERPPRPLARRGNTAQGALGSAYAHRGSQCTGGHVGRLLDASTMCDKEQRRYLECKDCSY